MQDVNYLEVSSHIQSVGIVFHACARPPNPKLLGDDGAATLEHRNLAEEHNKNSVIILQEEKNDEKESQKNFSEAKDEEEQCSESLSCLTEDMVTGM